MFKKNPNVLNHTFYFWMHIWRKQKTHNSIHHSLYETADLFKTIFTVKGHWFTSWPGQMDTICKVCAFSFCVNMVFFWEFFFCTLVSVQAGCGGSLSLMDCWPGTGFNSSTIHRKTGSNSRRHMKGSRTHAGLQIHRLQIFWLILNSDFFLLETCRFWFWQLFFSVKFQT